jgi:DNA-binding NtrC family response regulator
VDDNRSSAKALAKLLQRGGDDVEALFDGASAIARIEADPPDVVLTDLKMEPVDGMQVLAAARSSSPPIETIVFTAYGAVDVAVQAMHLGARDFLTKPVTVDQVAARLQPLRVDGDALHADAEDDLEAAFVARSEGASELLQTLKRAAGVPSPVWLGGELGSGRSFAAHTLHALGDAERGESTPFVEVNPRSPAPWPDHGTMVLPNIDALEEDRQLELVRRLGELSPKVRVIATAGADGRQQVATGALRPELYYRLAVVVISVPPLRRRKEDILPLYARALDHFAEKYGRPRPTISETDRERLVRHYWPGNIRELRNLAERTVVLGIDGFNLEVIEQQAPGLPKLEAGFSLSAHLEQVERSILEEALRQAGGDRTAAGKLLGVERNTLRYKLNKYGLLRK